MLAQLSIPDESSYDYRYVTLICEPVADSAVAAATAT